MKEERIALYKMINPMKLSDIPSDISNNNNNNFALKWLLFLFQQQQELRTENEETRVEKERRKERVVAFGNHFKV